MPTACPAKTWLKLIFFLPRQMRPQRVTVAMEPPNGLEIGGERFAVALVERSDELLCSLLRDFLDLFCFHFRSPVRGFGSHTRSRGTKEPRLQGNGRRQLKKPCVGQPA